MRAGLAGAVLVLLIGCSSPADETGSEPDAPATQGPTVTSRYEDGNTYPIQEVQNTYDVSRMTCAYRGLVETAKELGTDPNDRDATAREHSMLYIERLGHRDAGYIGCLKGFSDFDANGGPVGE